MPNSYSRDPRNFPREAGRGRGRDWPMGCPRVELAQTMELTLKN